MKELKLFRNKDTKSIVEVVVENEGFKLCDDYQLLKANSTDAAGEKHVPVVEVAGSTVTVKVGEVAHPMTEEHLINFIILHTEKGFQRVDLTATDAPEAVFELAAGDKAIAAYEYCNLHGLWVKEI